MKRAALAAVLLLAGCRHGPSSTSIEPCPRSPNCVSSASKGKRAIAPLAFTKEPDAAWAELRAAVVAMERVTLVKDEPGYIHAECRSPKRGYIDDLQLKLDADAKVVHVRSAARTGIGDRGVNRDRVEELRKRLGW